MQAASDLSTIEFSNPYRAAYAAPEKVKTPSQVRFAEKLPPPETFGPGAVLIYDRLLTRNVPRFANWSRRFPALFPVRAGEDLKDLEAFSRLLPRLVEKVRPFSSEELVLVAVGGGSVGDFAGFVSSVLRRGVRLIHLPSTWLAATDSAHGGKTALNVGDLKNQVGSFYWPERVEVCRELLRGLPPANARQSVSELVKIGLLDGGAWFTDLTTRRRGLLSSHEYWQALPFAVQAKYQIVERDPFDRRGVRRVLNLGHSLAHVIELTGRLNHGEAVAQGLLFAIDWSAEKGFLPTEQRDAWVTLLERRFGIVEKLPRVPLKRSDFLRAASADKKQLRRRLAFVFLEGLGHPLSRPVTLDEFADQARRRGWVGSVTKARQR